MRISHTTFPGSVGVYDITCEEHCSPATFVLQVGGVLIPLCQDCINDLFEELKNHVMQEGAAE